MLKFILEILIFFQCIMSVIIIGPAVFSYAEPGVLEKVSINRAAGITKFSIPENWKTYEVLLAVDSCGLIGKDAYIITPDNVYKALIVDCTNGFHNKLKDSGLVADTNNPQLTHQRGIIVLNGFSNLLDNSFYYYLINNGNLGNRNRS